MSEKDGVDSGFWKGFGYAIAMCIPFWITMTMIGCRILQEVAQ